ncbi:WXG100 family type VII secretion target [Amycolatopsis pithecellobii]|uniref:Uncharacterized protein n=1 Tax=Amycolatopsis pithecellobii TaxID=664692 RepID=A0A6N7YU00_9PSEU|nr:hypothetical protein [Amycolatopsis pithecellobii]MTD55408.1 hypothetical protein [Amycolatopsis pithecellobii]
MSDQTKIDPQELRDAAKRIGDIMNDDVMSVFKALDGDGSETTGQFPTGQWLQQRVADRISAIQQQAQILKTAFTDICTGLTTVADDLENTDGDNAAKLKGDITMMEGHIKTDSSQVGQQVQAYGNSPYGQQPAYTSNNPNDPYGYGQNTPAGQYTPEGQQTPGLQSRIPADQLYNNPQGKLPRYQEEPSYPMQPRIQSPYPTQQPEEPSYPMQPRIQSPYPTQEPYYPTQQQYPGNVNPGEVPYEQQQPYVYGQQTPYQQQPNTYGEPTPYGQQQESPYDQGKFSLEQPTDTQQQQQEYTPLRPLHKTIPVTPGDQYGYPGSPGEQEYQQNQ